MKIKINPAYHGQAISLYYIDKDGKERAYPLVLKRDAVLEVCDDPTQSEGIPSEVASAFLRRGIAEEVAEAPTEPEVPAQSELSPSPNPSPSPKPNPRTRSKSVKG
jgi:hypothetical protein